jgi:predicted type IV restriction endonuclease
MELNDEFKKVSEKIATQMENIETEEATKTAFVLPFLNALGYDIFDPTEVVPEFTADVGTKKGEKVDYAIMKDGEPIILMECKTCGHDLDKAHAAQLYRYFAFTKARFGVLTNGVIYRFFTDIDEPNKMDKKPFLEIDLSNLKDAHVEELKKFTKSSFDLEEILTSASELKYLGEMKKIITKEISDPSSDFVKFFAKQVYPGPITERIRIKFTEITKTAFTQFIKEQVNARLKSALIASDDGEEKKEDKEELSPKNKVVTTTEEWEGFYIVKAILSELIDVNRVTIRDNLSYCGIFLDNKNTQTICRLRFDTSQKYLGIINEHRKEEKIPIESVEDLYKYSEQLRNAVNSMTGK